MERHRRNNKAKILEILNFPYCNVWLRDIAEQKINAFQMKSFRRILRVPWTEKREKRVYPSITLKCRRDLAAEYSSSTQTGLFWACEKAWQSWAHNLWGYYWGQNRERPTKKKMESGHHWSSQHYRHRGRMAGAGPVCIPRSCQRRNVHLSLLYISSISLKLWIVRMWNLNILLHVKLCI